MSKLTKRDLERSIDQIFSKSSIPNRRFILYTGQKGLLTFDFTIKFGGTIKEKHFTTRFKRLPNIIFISLFKKQGLYKIKIVNSTFYFYKGATLINTITEVHNNFVIETLLGVSDEKIKKGIDKVNKYIKQLCNGL